MKLKLWHGGKRWDGEPAVRPPKKGRCEYGPGIYFTNSLEVAKKYAKGGKIITLAEIEVNQWLETAECSFHEIVKFVANRSWKGKNRLMENLMQAGAIRTKHGLTGFNRPVSSLVNEFVNAGLTGKAGVELAEWLAGRGIDASCTRSYGHDVVVVFNPKAIVDWKVVPSSEINYDEPTELPRVEILEELSNATH